MYDSHPAVIGIVVRVVRREALAGHPGIQDFFHVPQLAEAVPAGAAAAADLDSAQDRGALVGNAVAIRLHESARVRQTLRGGRSTFSGAAHCGSAPRLVLANVLCQGSMPCDFRYSS